MNSFFANFFIDLQEFIKSNVPEILWVEQNFGQYGDPEFSSKTIFPACLIDFNQTTYSNMGGNIQLGACNVNLVLLFKPFSQSYSSAPNNVKERALEYYNIEHKLATALNGWAMDYFTPLTRMSAISQNRNEIGLRIRELNFTTEFEDWSTEDETNTNVELVFNGAIEPIVI